MQPFDAAWALLKMTGAERRHFNYLGTLPSWEGDRDMGTFQRKNPISGKIRKYPFYRSTGKNSDEPGSWKHFHGLTTHPEEIEHWANNLNGTSKVTPHRGWVIKPQIPGHGLTNTRYLEQSEDPKAVRYGSLGIEDYSGWMNQKVGKLKFDKQYKNMEEMNQALIDDGALFMHNMARGVEQPPSPPQPGSLQAQGSQPQEQ